MEAEAEIVRTKRRAEAAAEAASTAIQKIAVLEAKKAEVVHCSVQQVMETQDVQVCRHHVLLPYAVSVPHHSIGCHLASVYIEWTLFSGPSSVFDFGGWFCNG